MANRKKKILHIVEDLKVGGLEKVLASIVLSLDKNSYDVQVWCLSVGGDVADELTEKGITVRILGKESYNNPWQVLTLACLFRRERFHIIHTHGYFAGTFGRLAAILANVPVIITHVHSTYYEYSRRNLMIERILSVFTDCIVCISRSVQKFVVENENIRVERTRIIYNAIEFQSNGLSIEDKGEKRTSLGISPQDVVVIIVASLTSNKGHHVLLKAFDKVHRKNPFLKLIIVGEGPLRMELQEEASASRIESDVIFTGLRKDVPELLGISDIFVLPSISREGLGIALIEAMAMSLPVIGSDIGGIPEVIENHVNGFLVPPGNADRLTHAIETLVSDPDLRKRMGRQGRKIYEQKFTLPKMIQQIEDLYDQLLAEKIRVIRT
jgi:glycosyltransferase involved in cell wall biosynthesis